MDILSFANKKLKPILYFSIDYIKYKKIPDLKKSQWWNIEKLEQFQNRRLRKIIKYAYKNIPGYAWLFAKKDSFNIGIGEFMPYRKYVKKKINLVNSFKSYFQTIKQQYRFLFKGIPVKG